MLDLTVSAPDDLHLISGEIHDSFFDADDIRFDEAASELTIPFRRWSYEEARVIRRERHGLLARLLKTGPEHERWRAPWYRWNLVIRNVTRHAVEDHAGHGGSDFNDIEYDERSRTLTIDCNVPFTITASVTSLEVSVTETDELLGEAEYSTCGSSDSYSGAIIPLETAPGAEAD